MKLNSYFSFMQGAKSANSKLFKDFCNEAEMEKNSQIVGFILSSSLKCNIVLPKGKSFYKKLVIFFGKRRANALKFKNPKGWYYYRIHVQKCIKTPKG